MEDQRTPRGRAWRFYFWFWDITVALAAGSAIRGSDPAELLFGALDTAVAVMGLRGLQGYVYGREYLTRRTWAWFGPAFILWSTGVLALIGNTLYRETGATVAMVVTAALFSIQLPQFWALLHYGRTAFRAG